MWILPRPLHTSDFVPDTAALSLDSTESSEICARSLFVRSKPSPVRTWSQKWKRDSWTALLSGRILRPSHGQSFVTAWTSSLVATPASHSAQQASGSEPKTLGTSGHLSQTEFGFSDPSSASSRMSRAISPSDSAKSLESWEQSVIRRRGEYSARRLMRGRLTSASGSSSWPSPIASEVRQGVQDRSRGMKGSQESLTTVVVRHGLPAPANPSTLGSRQGLWPTATVGDSANAANKTASRLDLTSNHHSGTTLVDAMKQWATPRLGGEEKAETRLARGKDIGLHGQVGAMTNSAKLNPRWVETLMGLPVGWTMPSCKSPVTIELTSCASLATESSQQQQNELFECFGRKD